MGQAADMGVVVRHFTMVIASFAASVDLQIILGKEEGSLMIHSEKGTAQRIRVRRRRRRARKFSRGEWWVLVGAQASSSRCLDGTDALKQGAMRRPVRREAVLTPTMDQFKAVFDQGIGHAIAKLRFVTGISTILVLLLGYMRLRAVASAVRRTQDGVLFFMSTSCCPSWRRSGRCT